jgi:hypothetical protein
LGYAKDQHNRGHSFSIRRRALKMIGFGTGLRPQRGQVGPV